MVPRPPPYFEHGFFPQGFEVLLHGELPVGLLVVSNTEIDTSLRETAGASAPTLLSQEGRLFATFFREQADI